MPSSTLPTQPLPATHPSAASPDALAAKAQRGIRFLLSLTVFLGAFLLFLIEPLFAKLILPWFGGSAAVWATCLVFFQSALLLGYLYAHLTSRHLRPAQQSLLHIGLLLASLLLLPVVPHATWRPQAGQDPAWRILGLLTAAIGLPFLLLSATSPLVQTWYARRRNAAPYHLFALSNLASFLALLSYPFFIEPHMHGPDQARLWSALFVAFAVICSLAAWIGRGKGAPAERVAVSIESSPPPAARTKLLWLGLSACGAMLLLAITNHLTQNVAPIPLLWVLPLALYLLTFTMVFHRRNLYSRWLMVRLLAVTLGGIGYAIYDPSFTHRIQVNVPLFCTGLFVCCLFCHGELARLKPAPQFLTTFYLMISLGGALGAVLIGLVAPRIFRNVYEFPATLVLTAALALAVLWSDSSATAEPTILSATAGRTISGTPAWRTISRATAKRSTSSATAERWTAWLARAFWMGAVVAMGVVLVLNVRSYRADSLLMVRNFYGALRVKQYEETDTPGYRGLYHGRIEHGVQALKEPLRLQPTTYYGPDSGAGLALRFCCEGPKRAGVIGLGAGTLAAYGQPGDTFRFYEINPQVVDIARDWFTYLAQSRARTEIIRGDGRLSLEGEPPQQFDILAVDAFSGDAIPFHLLTKEALALYLRHLKPDGILAIHTSNAYLNLAPVVRLLADDAGYECRLIINNEDENRLIDKAEWVLVTRNRAFLDRPETRAGAAEIKIPARLRPWTDDYNSLFPILRPVRFSESDSS